MPTPYPDPHIKDRFKEEYKSFVCVILAIILCITLSIFYPNPSGQSGNEVPKLSLTGDLGKNIKDNVLFYLFFASWIFRYVPQISINKTRKSTIGVSPDFTLWHLVANSSLTILFVLHTYFGYADKLSWLGVECNPILANIFIFENLFSVLILGLQTIQLNGGWKMHKPSWPLMIVVVALLILTVIGLLLVKTILGNMLNFDKVFDIWQTCLVYLFFLATIFRLIPQIQLNNTKKSTVGFSLAFSFLDFTGAAAIIAILVQKNLAILTAAFTSGFKAGDKFNNALVEELVFLVTCIVIVFEDLILIIHGFSLKNKDDGYVPASILHSTLAPGSADTSSNVDNNFGVSHEDVELEQALAASASESTDAEQAHHGNGLFPASSNLPSPSHNSRSWTCIRCTFVNDFTKEQCEVCKLTREKSIQPDSRTSDEAMLFGR